MNMKLNLIKFFFSFIENNGERSNGTVFTGFSFKDLSPNQQSSRISVTLTNNRKGMHCIVASLALLATVFTLCLTFEIFSSVFTSFLLFPSLDRSAERLLFQS